MIRKDKKKFEEIEAGVQNFCMGRDIRALIKSEFDAIDLYQQMANCTSSSEAKKVFLDIAEEEKVHVGELTKLLALFDGGTGEGMETGAKEVAELVSERIKKMKRGLAKDEKKSVKKPKGGGCRRVSEAMPHPMSSRHIKAVLKDRLQEFLEEEGIEYELAAWQDWKERIDSIAEMESEEAREEEFEALLKMIKKLVVA